jgi:hypothetical protein
MQAVSRWLEKNPGAHTLNQIETHVKGKAEYKRDAIEQLVRDGYAVESKGPNRARLIELVKPYQEPEEGFVPGSSPVRPDEVNPGSSLRPPLTGDEDEPEMDEGRGSSRDEPTLDQLLEKHAHQLTDTDIPF